MAETPKPLVDDELYVNDATLEALRNSIELEVRRSLRNTVLWPLLVAGATLLLFAAFWLIPREVATLVRDDPIVKQRFLDATKAYIADEQGGQQVVRRQVIAAVQADDKIKEAIEVAVASALSELDVDQIVRVEMAQALEARLKREMSAFLNGEQGRELLNEAVGEYLNTEAGAAKLDAVGSKALESAEFQRTLIDELARALGR